MAEQPVLTQQEWELLAELVDRERRDLPAEIHHTLVSSMRDSLRDRRRAIEELLKKIEEYTGSTSGIGSTA